MKFRSFDDYLEKTITFLKAAGSNEANYPFEWRPDNPQPKPGVLIIHGLFESPYKMRDIANFYLEQGFIVRSILLPGHGTKPDDLLNVSCQDWIELTNFAIEDLATQVEQVHLCGFSTGANLSLNYTIDSETDDSKVNISSLCLVAPALSVNGCNPLSVFITKLLGRISRHFQWVYRENEKDFARYSSIPFKPVHELFKLCQAIAKKLKTTQLKTPMFICASEQDFTVNFKPILTFFKQQKSPQHKMLIYTSKPRDFGDERIREINSKFPERNVLDLSHFALLVSPDNPHYGCEGDYQLPLLTPKKYDPCEPVYTGEIHLRNRRYYPIRRITFNLGFDELLSELGRFVSTSEA